MIPFHAGGPHVAWNIVNLKENDHVKAHKLRYQVYGEFGDQLFVRIRNCITNAKQKTNTCDKAQESKNSFSKKLKVEMSWAHPDLKNKLFIRSGVVSSISELAYILLNSLPEDSNSKKLINNRVNYLSDGIRKVLKGERLTTYKWKLL